MSLWISLKNHSAKDSFKMFFLGIQGFIDKCENEAKEKTRVSEIKGKK